MKPMFHCAGHLRMLTVHSEFFNDFTQTSICSLAYRFTVDICTTIFTLCSVGVVCIYIHAYTGM